jgi:hypothetical protein
MKQLEHGYVVQRAKCNRCPYLHIKDMTFFGLKENIFSEIQVEHQVASPNCDGRLTIVYDNAVREEE